MDGLDLRNDQLVPGRSVVKTGITNGCSINEHESR